MVTVGPVFSQNANSQYASNPVFAMDAKAHKGFQWYASQNQLYRLPLCKHLTLFCLCACRILQCRDITYITYTSRHRIASNMETLHMWRKRVKQVSILCYTRLMKWWETHSEHWSFIVLASTHIKSKILFAPRLVYLPLPNTFCLGRTSYLLHGWCTPLLINIYTTTLLSVH